MICTGTSRTSEGTPSPAACVSCAGFWFGTTPDTRTLPETLARPRAASRLVTPRESQENGAHAP